MSTDQNPPAEPLPSRVASVDTYRGAVMFLMMAEVLELAGSPGRSRRARPGRPWRSTSRTSSGAGARSTT